MEAAASDDSVGRRLLAHRVDYLAAHDPQRIWAAIPVDDYSLAAGYRDVTFRQFANAVNHAAWWLDARLAGEADLATITYNGPRDVRYPILAVAAVKCRKKLLLNSPFASLEAKRNLLKLSRCTTFIYAASTAHDAELLLDGIKPDIRLLEIPDLDAWLTDNQAPSFPYAKTWEEAADDPWLIFHSSGTSGMPKMIPYTNSMMTSFDAAELMPDASTAVTMNALFKDRRFLTSIPPFHFVGMTAALQWPAWLNTVYVIGPAVGPPSAQQAVEVIKLGRANGVMMPPAVLENICRDTASLATMRALECIYFAGSPLPGHVATQLNKHCVLVPGMGSTEAGAYWVAVRGDDSWEYYGFRPANGIVMEPRGNDMFELTFHRKPELARWQQVFQLFPDLDVYRTKDLWTRHPSGADLWRYAGRSDDVVIMANGHNLYATDPQHIIQEAPGVRAVLVGGEGREQTFLLLELLKQDTHLSPSEREAELDAIWPFVARANENCSQVARFARERIIFTDPAKPLPLTAKDTVVRRQALELYTAEIEALYAPNSVAS